MLKKLGDVLTVYDKILIILIILVTLGGIGWSTFYVTGSNSKYVIIEHNNQMVHKIRLVGSLKKEIPIDLNPGKAEVVIRDGKVKIREMPREICPLGICADTGWISGNGEMIICIPNQIAITIKSQSQTEEPDAIVH